VQQVSPPWTSLVLVCTSCRGDALGPRDIRKGLKRSLDKHRVRVLEVDCLKLCPARAVAVCTVGRHGAHAYEVHGERELTELAAQIEPYPCAARGPRAVR
jgi:hypothetical protein